ncbi:MAG TPA: septation protein SpoVG family protein [Planctomycetota bacterium]|nr:septation protein SpoVG family protein [Planctomycetota bacterium]
MTDESIRVRSWVKANEAEARKGLLAFISVYVGELIVDGITLRKTATGRLALSFPQRESRSGHRHAVVRPIDDHARREIEEQILGELLENEKGGLVTEDPR